MGQMLGKTAVQMKDHFFSGEKSINIVHVLSKLNCGWNISRIHDDAILELFPDFIKDSAPAVIEARLTLLSADLSMNEFTNTSYAETVHHLLRCFATNEVVTKAGDQILDFKEKSLTRGNPHRNYGSWHFIEAASTTNPLCWSP